MIYLAIGIGLAIYLFMVWWLGRELRDEDSNAKDYDEELEGYNGNL